MPNGVKHLLFSIPSKREINAKQILRRYIPQNDTSNLARDWP